MWQMAHAIELDTHVHTIASGHSWSSFGECVEQAKSLGHRGICITEHSALVKNAPPEWLPESQVMLPKFYKGIRVYRGLEADILATDGTLTPPEKYLRYLEFCIASIHGNEPGKAGSADERTSSYIHALRNPYVDVLGHIDRTACDMEAVVSAARQNGKMIELNNQTMKRYLHGYQETTVRLLSLCKEQEVFVCVGSDAHVHTMIGDFEMAEEVLKRVEFPLELVLNYNFKDFDSYIEKKRERLQILD